MPSADKRDSYSRALNTTYGGFNIPVYCVIFLRPMKPPEGLMVELKIFNSCILIPLRPTFWAFWICVIAPEITTAYPVTPTSTDVELSPCSQFSQEANSAQNAEGTTTSMHPPPSGRAFHITQDWTDIKYIFDEPRVQKAQDGVRTKSTPHGVRAEVYKYSERPPWYNRPTGVFSLVMGVLLFFVGVSALGYSSLQLMGNSKGGDGAAAFKGGTSSPFPPWVSPNATESAATKQQLSRHPRQVRDSNTQTLLSFHPDGVPAEKGGGLVVAVESASSRVADLQSQAKAPLPSESAVLTSRAKPLAKALEEMAASIVSATAEVNAWAEEVKKALKRPHSVEKESFFASDRLMAALRHMQGNALEAIQIISKDMHRTALLVEQLTSQGSGEIKAGQEAAVAAALSDVRRLVETAGQSQFVVACMWNELMAAAGTVERETFGIALEEFPLMNLAHRMSRPLPAHLLEGTDAGELAEYILAEEHLVREMSTVARKYSPTLSRGSMVETMNKAMEDQHMFLNIIQSIRSGGSPTGFPPLAALRKEAAGVKGNIVQTGGYFLQILPKIFQNASRERDALSFLIPPSASAGATWANSPLHRLSDILRTGVNTVMQSLEEEERRLHALTADGIEKTTAL